MSPKIVKDFDSTKDYWVDEDSLVLVSTTLNISPPTNIYKTPEGRYLSQVKGKESFYRYLPKQEAIIELIRRGEGSKLSVDDFNYVEGRKLK